MYHTDKLIFVDVGILIKIYLCQELATQPFVHVVCLNKLLLVHFAVN